MSTSAAPRARAHWGLLVTASAMLMLTMGARQTTGLFVEPIHRQTGIGIASISFAQRSGNWSGARCNRCSVRSPISAGRFRC